MEKSISKNVQQKKATSKSEMKVKKAKKASKPKKVNSSKQATP